LPELLKLIETLTSDLGKATVSEIAELIEQDAVVMSRLLAVANTIYHNPHIAPLSSVSHAIHQVGFQRIRSLAVSLMLLENTGGADRLPEQRDAAAHALCSGLIAQGAARVLGSVDPEMAFACASLRQLGGILLPVVSLDHFRTAQGRLATKSEEHAFRGVFGLTPLELTHQLLSESRLPKDIVRSFREYEPESGGRVVASAENRLVAVVDAAGHLARLTLDPRGNLESFQRQAGLLMRKYYRLVPDDSGLVESALQHAGDRIASFARASLGNSLPAAMVRLIQSRVRDPAALESAKLEKGGPPRVVGTATAITPGASGVPWPADVRPGFALRSGGPGPAVSAAQWAEVAAGMRDIFEAYEISIFLPAPGGVSCVLAHGVGGHWSQYRSRAALRPDEPTVFGICLSRKKVVAIHNTRDPGIQRYLPEWFQGSEHRLGAFLLVPCSEPRDGLVLVGWRDARHIAITPEQTELARQLLGDTAAGSRPEAPAAPALAAPV
jgi:HD-like signal output (HDOD) protein